MKKLIAGCAIILTALVLAGCPQPTAPEVVKSSEKALLSFKFEQSKNTAVLTQDYVATWNPLQQKWTVGPLPAGTDVTALVATFTVSPKATVSISGVAQTSGVTANDFTNAKVYTVTAEDGSTANYTVEVTVTQPSSAKDITAYSLSDGTYNFVGIIDENAAPNPTITVSIPAEISRTGLVATFTLSDAIAIATVNEIQQISGTTSNDFSSDVNYVVTAQDQSTKTYTVKVVEPTPAAAQIIQICPSYSNAYAQAQKGWLDIKVKDATKLADGMKVYYGYYNNEPTLLLDLATVTFTISDNDTIRIHENGYLFNDTSNKNDDGYNNSIWDVTTTSAFFINISYSVIWIENNNGDILDFLAYSSNSNITTNHYWPTNANVIAKMNLAVTSKQWAVADNSLGVTYTDAVNAGDLTANNTLILIDSFYNNNKDANSKNGWQLQNTAEAVNLTTQKVVPNYINTSLGDKTILLKVKPVIANGTISEITAQVTGITGIVTLNDTGVNGDEVASDGTYSSNVTIPKNSTVGSVNVVYNAKTSNNVVAVQVTKVLQISNQDTNMVFLGSNFEITPETTTFASIASIGQTTGHDGNSTNALHISGTIPNASSIFLTADPCYDKGTFTKVTFWIKGTAIPKPINLEFGNKTSNIPLGQLFVLNTMNTSLSFNYYNNSGFNYTSTNGITADGTWYKVTLVLNDATNPTNTVNQFLIRLGSGTYDFWIDDILFE